MREFFKQVLASFLGFILAAVILGALSVGMLIGIISSMNNEKTTVVSDNSVLYLNLDQTILERTPDDTFANLPIVGSEGEKHIGFYDVIRSLEKAKTDKRIRCIYLDVSAPDAGHATLKEIRDALVDFRSSGKKIIAYSEVYSQKAYYLASAANKVYLNPEGNLEFKGLSSQLMFFKGALDKLGIEAQVIRAGNYKSAVEPFMLDKMSDKNREQVSAYMNGLYQNILQAVSESRKLSIDELHQIADGYQIRRASDALSLKMVDGLRYKDEVLDELKQLSGKSKKKSINSVSINEYAKSLDDENEGNGKDKIAVVYANGDIMGGEGNNETIGSAKISRTLRRLRADSSVKAIVLRVNSPGGSALASDVIWREIILAKKSKPVIASFGDVAASGGYYIACAADSIFVQPNTITGSIGVFGVIPNLQHLLNDKLGITFDGVKTARYADIMSMNRPLTAGERLIIQNDVNHVYDTFIGHVADGRKKTKAEIDSIGGGHVWVGSDAVKNGLADRIGNFRDAIRAAASKAGTQNYEVVFYPELLSPLKTLIQDGSDNFTRSKLKAKLGESYLIYQQLDKVIGLSGIQARLPFQAISE
ncbi:signal peptide peptidase SppA [Pedobacter sp. JY14-1]|uniref:signal peptide peptidase SppA n=1 Tax=Pedobacter sp. JY14-1 TaxID=3034151 RepID=UPI0023E33F42|nr:signal peptide peptidase SppA [Pedobacter sp. JY14-1]